MDKNFNNQLLFILKRFKWYEWLYLIAGVISITTLSIIYKSSALTIILSLFGIFYVTFLAKQIKFSVIFGLVQTILYIIQSALYNNWGEFAINILVVFPLLLSTLITWLSKKEKGVVVTTHEISWKEWLILILIDLVISIAFYFILDYFETPYLIFATISVFFTSMANYLLLRKSFYMFFVFIATNATMILIWLMPIIEGVEKNFETIPMLVLLCFYTISNILGIVNWRKRKVSDKDALHENAATMEKK